MNNSISKLFYPAVVILYFSTRLVNLKIIPIFTDEAIYSYWAQVALNDPANRFISLEDGKQPLFIWIAAILQKFIHDPLVATRLVSVFSGFGSLIGLYLLTKELFNEKVAKIATVLYVILPFTLLYDRLAVFDSLLTMLGIYAVLISVRLIRELKLDLAIINGFSIGLAMITKSSGNFFLYLLPFSIILFNFEKKNITRRLIKWTGLLIITFILTQIIYNALRLSPLFYIIAIKNISFIRTFTEVLQRPTEHLLSNFKAITGWIITYVSPLLFIVFLTSLFYGFRKRERSVIYLSIVIFVPFIAEVIFNKILYARFVLFYFPYIIVLIAYFIGITFSKYPKFKKQLIIIFAFILLFPVFTSYRLITNPPEAHIPENDKSQYLNDWPAGYGVQEVVNIIKQESQNKDVYIGTEGTFGLFPYSLNIYFYGNPRVHVIGYWPVNSNELPGQITDFAKNNKTYFIFNFTQQDITNSRLKFVAKYQKGTGNSFMRLYEVVS